MAADESIDWELGNAPKQSITELLHNPRGPKLELPDVTLELPALSLTPVPSVTVPEPLDINHFESYLRQYAPLYEAYQARKTAVVQSPRSLDAVPPHYLQSDFSLADNEDLASLSSDQPLADNPHLPQIRLQLATHKTTLEHHLKRVIDQQTPSLTAALNNIQNLREAILSTVTALRQTRENAENLIPTVITPIEETQRLTQAQTNLHQLKSALKSIELITSAPSDIAILLDAGEYAAAIDAVHSAREELAHPHLARIAALASVRARLAQSVENIDAALRRQFREALADANQALLREVVALVSKLGRLTTLHRFFMREIKDRLSDSLKGVTNVSQAAKVVKASAESAVMLVGIINDCHDCKPARRQHLQEAHGDFEEMLVAVADRVLGSFTEGPVGGFIVITRPEIFTPETCFDEFKAALRFGEEVRSLDELATELEQMFSIDKRGGPLRAKISERQISFVSAFHKAHSDVLTEAVRADKWQETRVPDGARRLLAAVVDIPIENEANGESNGLLQGKSVNISAEKDDATPGTFMIGSHSFKAVTCAVRYVRSMCAYTLLTEKSPALASEVARRGADYCRNFNALVGKAILGAAALQWAGLRSITARHLSLASRTIAMAASLAEQTNKPLEKALSRAQAGIVLPLLQKSEKDLRDHHGQLLAKVLAIMMDRLEAHEAVLKSLPWDKYQEMQRFDIPTAYVVTLSKEAAVLHRILWSVLPKTEVSDIFQRVCAAYGTHLTEAYSALDGGKRWIRLRVAKDVACLHERLLALDVFKANPESFKPLSKLYSRFAKEFLEEEEKNPGGRSFIRQQNKQAPKSAPQSSKPKESAPTAKKVESSSDTNAPKDRENTGEHSTIVTEVDTQSDPRGENDVRGEQKTRSDTEQAPRDFPKETNSEERSTESKVEPSGEGNSNPSDAVTITEAGHSNESRSELTGSTAPRENRSAHDFVANIQQNRPPAGLTVQPGHNLAHEVVKGVQENGHMDTQKSSERELPSPENLESNDETETINPLDQKTDSSARDLETEGSHEQKENAVPEGDLLHLGNDG